MDSQLDPIDLIGVADIAAILGVRPRTARDKVVTLPDFPMPVVQLSQRMRRWSRTQIEEYLLSRTRAGR
jgi:predicted DNA-binding transcriptional regulator AlpA